MADKPVARAVSNPHQGARMSERYECWIVEMDFRGNGEWKPYTGSLLGFAYESEQEARKAIEWWNGGHWLRTAKYVEAAPASGNGGKK